MKALSTLLFVAGLTVLPAIGEEAKPDAKALAFSYATAFENMGKSSVSILYANSGQTETIKDVTQITAYGAVLLVKAYGGSKQILDASRVIKITDN
ncbi:MAG TPA: hypothetical protein VIM61_16640 [Chthoniobacterales bacterium]|jgi:hypothetical protein